MTRHISINKPPPPPPVSEQDSIQVKIDELTLQQNALVLRKSVMIRDADDALDLTLLTDIEDRFRESPCNTSENEWADDDVDALHARSRVDLVAQIKRLDEKAVRRIKLLIKGMDLPPKAVHTLICVLGTLTKHMCVHVVNMTLSDAQMVKILKRLRGDKLDRGLAKSVMARHDLSTGELARCPLILFVSHSLHSVFTDEL